MSKTTGKQEAIKASKGDTNRFVNSLSGHPIEKLIEAWEKLPSEIKETAVALMRIVASQGRSERTQRASSGAIFRSAPKLLKAIDSNW